jgi:hypothetical protein
MFISRLESLSHHTMFRLPVELQRHCVRFLNSETLRVLRLVSKTALPLGTEYLFSTLNVLPTESSARNYINVLENATLNPLVRRVIFNTSENPEDPGQKESELLDSFEEAMHNVGRFPKLREIEVRFASECIREDGEDGLYGLAKDVAETTTFRTEVLKSFFRGLNHAEHPATTCDSLTIKNLQDWTDEEIYESENFQAVCKRLKRLHLQIATESDDASPENSIEKPGCHHGFTEDLPDRWLKPLQSQLTHLTIYGTECFWGMWPFCDLRGIHFPKLKSLALGNFTFVHDWQVDWILSHGHTLKELVLDDCPIVTVLDLDEAHIVPNWPDLPLIQGDDYDCYIKYVDLRWHQVLHRFQYGLPHLTHFTLGQGDWSNQTMFEERYEMLPRSLPCRYYMFEHDVGPSQWIGGDRGNYYIGNETFPECEKEDMEALTKLCVSANRG